jgi:putative acetyltransferase
LKPDAQHLVRLSQDFERLDKVLETLEVIEDRRRVSKDAQELQILATSAAYELQHLYTGFEKIIERRLDFTGSVVTPGGGYHKQLLSWALNEKLITSKIDTDFLTDLLGFRHFVRNFILGDNQGHRIDLHSFEIDTSGENTFGVAYRAEHLSGVGMIDGYQVRCVAPDWMVKFHTGYPLDKNDFSDVKALCEKFEIEMPEEHQAYWRFLEENSIRSETINDQDAIREIHRLAFGGPAEAKLVDDLRQSADALISLAAERDGRIIGHVLFSRLKAPMKALGLAPVAIHPSFQKQGVGSALIREGLDRARKDGWMCVFVLGDPGYYGRFGFRAETAKGYSSPYSGDHFMAAPLSEIPKSGEIVYPKPFKLLDS